MTEQYRFNPACAEQRTPKDVLKELPFADRKAFSLMTEDEINYLVKDCYIDKYVKYLRAGRKGLATGEDFPILVVKGTPLQLDRFRIVLLLKLIDFQGVAKYYPADFTLGDEKIEELRKFPGVAIIKIPKGASTSEGLDAHRTELITSVLATRRDLFNPSIVLAEENISGKFSVSNSLLQIIKLDTNRLTGDYEDNTTEYNDMIVSRVKKESSNTFYNTSSNNTFTTNNYSKSKNNKKMNVNALAEMYEED